MNVNRLQQKKKISRKYGIKFLLSFTNMCEGLDGIRRLQIFYYNKNQLR